MYPGAHADRDQKTVQIRDLAEPVLFEIFRFVTRIPNDIGMLIRNRY